MFTVHGIAPGLPGVTRLTWDAGQLEGDHALIDRVRELVTDGTSLPLTPTGPAIIASLAEPADALRTIAEVFEQVQQVTGDVPQAPEAAVPGGAVP